MQKERVSDFSDDQEKVRSIKIYNLYPVYFLTRFAEMNQLKFTVFNVSYFRSREKHAGKKRRGMGQEM